MRKWYLRALLFLLLSGIPGLALADMNDITPQQLSQTTTTISH